MMPQSTYYPSQNSSIWHIQEQRACNRLTYTKTTGTLKDPIMVNSFGDEQYCGCTGFPADSHTVLWITVRSLPPSKLPSPSLTQTTPSPQNPIHPSTHKPPSAKNPHHFPQLSRAHPLNRCRECGSCYKMEYIGPPDDPHDDHHGHDDAHPKWVEAKNWTDYVRPEYRCGR